MNTMPIRDLLDRTPQLHDEYVLTLGGAVYYFSLAERMAVACCEAMQEGYTNDVCNKELGITAGTIARKLIKLTKKTLPDSPEKQTLLIASDDFLALVDDDRNPLLHAYPVTGVDRRAVLYNPKLHKDFPIEELVAYAYRAFDCENALNQPYYNFLNSTPA